MVGADSIKGIMRMNELHLSIKERWITCECLVQKINSTIQTLSLNCTEAYTENQVLRPAVEFERRNVASRALLDCVLLRRRELGLQLVGYRFGDLTLNREDIGEVAVVSLRPEMRIVAGIDQLRVHPHATAHALHAAFHQMRDPELLR